MSDLTWTNETRKLSDLKAWLRNPRRIKGEQGKRLVKSYETFEQPFPLVIGPNGELYDGHQRLDKWGAEYGLDLEVDVRVASRPLTEKEREQLTVYAHRGTTGEWDFDAFDGWDVDELVEWGFEKLELFDEGVIEPDFAPVGIDEQPRLDERSPVFCPHCGANIYDDPIG